MGAEIVALKMALDSMPKRVKIENKEDWPEYVPERKTHLIYTPSTLPGTLDYMCSECNHYIDNKGNYCMYCGAKIEKNFCKE